MENEFKVIISIKFAICSNWSAQRIINELEENVKQMMATHAAGPVGELLEFTGEVGSREVEFNDKKR